jgi:hypothetical protein
VPFDCLAISDEQREVVLALAERQSDKKLRFDDFVAGKGRGLNVLLQYESYAPNPIFYLYILIYNEVALRGSERL